MPRAVPTMVTWLWVICTASAACTISVSSARTDVLMLKVAATAMAAAVAIATTEWRKGNAASAIIARWVFCMGVFLTVV